ncbi:hypothetical protein SAMN05444170_6998 [Bradyrhizobium erythrophlei]|jgi:hypothetical protein|uniref:Uncharacterized protein n=1 Tax=Bradyrhizobium erythrophlei TaxID=1437360 RepID=A0A1M7UVX6_9BRAD|nr:hypothetical protein SAMN05444170_6998 [Bradyrhizobium erythrophlei]
MSRNERVIRLAALALGLALTHSGAFAAEPSKNAYPGAFDRPPVNEEPALTKDEQSKLKDDLTKARDRQNSQVKTKEATPALKTKSPSGK